MNKDTVKKVNQSIIFVAGGNLLAGILLLFTYSKTDEIWFLIAAVAMLAGAAAYLIVVSRYKKKLEKLNNRNNDSL